MSKRPDEEALVEVRQKVDPTRRRPGAAVTSTNSANATSRPLEGESRTWRTVEDRRVATIDATTTTRVETPTRASSALPSLRYVLINAVQSTRSIGGGSHDPSTTDSSGR
jgi:hypothetical protein